MEEGKWQEKKERRGEGRMGKKEKREPHFQGLQAQFQTLAFFYVSYIYMRLSAFS